MMKIRNLNKTKLIITSIMSVLVILALFMTLLATVQFDIRKVNWFDFCYSITNWMIGRTIYFPLGTDVGEQNPEVQLLEATINKYRNLIFKKSVTKEVEEQIDQYNKLSKIDAYVAYLDSKLNKAKGKKAQKIINKKAEVLEYLKSIQDPNYKYDGDFNIATVRIAYDHLDFGTCLSFGTATRKPGAKYKINLGMEGVKKAVPSLMWTVIISLINGSLTFMQYGFTLQAMFTFLIKLVLFVLGCYNGITLGKAVVEEDKYQVLLNITAKMKEVITDVERKLGIKIDEEQTKAS